MKNKILSITVIFIMAISFAKTVLAEKYVIKFSHVVSEGTPKGKAAKLFAELVNEKLKGKVKMEVYPNSQLYDDNKVIEAMRLSTSKMEGLMAAPSLSKFTKFSKKLQLFDLPFLFNDINDVHKLMDSDIAEEMIAPLKSKGIVGLGFLDNGMKVFSIKNDKPLLKLSAFKGKKFRIQSSDVHATMIESLGGVPQKLAFKEVYQALSQGTVDGQENAWSNVRSKKFYEVQDYITVSNHSYLGYLLVVSRAFWEGLPTDIKTELEAILQEVKYKSREFAAQADKADRATIEKAGFAKVVEISKEDRQTWIDANQAVHKKFAPSIGEDLVKKAKALLAN